MDADIFLSTAIDSISKSDRENAFYMMGMIPNDFYEINYIKLNNKLDKNIDKVEESFSIYKNQELLEKISKLKHMTGFTSGTSLPYCFNVKFGLNEINEIFPLIICPKIFDEASYPFMGHEFHHILKDTHPEERKLRDRLAEVIPMFYELVCAEKEEREDIRREILKRRMLLLTLDKINDNNSNRRLQYFNSYYYALGLYDRYKKNPVLVLRLVTRVLNGEINTLELLELLNLYEADIDNKVLNQFMDIKEYIK